MIRIAILLALALSLGACATADPFTQGALMVQMGMH